MKRAVIFVNGNLADVSRAKKIITKEDILIAADGGVKHILKLRLIPNVIIGDFDSISLSLQKKLKKIRTDRSRPVRTLIKYPIKKDKTDFELVIDYCLEKKFREIVIFGILGNRIDHLIANILLLAKIQTENKSVKIKIIEGNQEVFVIYKETVINGRIGDELSIIPITKLKGITTDGLEYKLNNETVAFGATRGISNVLNKTTARLKITDGIGLIISNSIKH